MKTIYIPEMGHVQKEGWEILFKVHHPTAGYVIKEQLERKEYKTYLPDPTEGKIYVGRYGIVLADLHDMYFSVTVASITQFDLSPFAE